MELKFTKNSYGNVNFILKMFRNSFNKDNSLDYLTSLIFIFIKLSENKFRG